MKRLITGIVVLFSPAHAFTQDSSEAKLQFKAYLEVYYSYDLSKPANHQKPPFFYNHSRHNELNLNLGYLKASYEDERVRANLALMAGTYAQANMSSEPAALRNIFEANGGCRLGKEQLWLDAGVFVSHIGLESVIGRDNWELTRSIVADNSPYYESGLRLSYQSKDEKFYLAGYYLNGWQRITRIDGNQSPAFGTQLTYKPTKHMLLNWSTFAGNVYPDSLKRWRYYNNLYAIAQLSRRFGMTAAFDIGLEQKQTGASNYAFWAAPLLILQYKFSEKLRLAVRGEYFGDGDELIIANPLSEGFYTMGYSSNIDIMPSKHLLFRFEARALHSKTASFTLNNLPSNRNYCFSACMALTL